MISCCAINLADYQFQAIKKPSVIGWRAMVNGREIIEACSIRTHDESHLERVFTRLLPEMEQDAREQIAAELQ